MRHRLVPLVALVLILAAPLASLAQNTCDAGKLQCVRKKLNCLIKVHAKAWKKGLPPDAAKLQACMDKFDGGADPTKGCFAKVEAKSDVACTTTGNGAAIEAQVDQDVQDYLDALVAVLTSLTVVCNTGDFEPADHPLFADSALDPDHFAMWEFGGGTTGFSAPLGVRIVCRAEGFFDTQPLVPVDLTDQVAWSTNLPGVAQVAGDGIVTTTGLGTATITATLGALNDGEAVQVNNGTLRGSPAIAVMNRIGEPDPLSRPVGVMIPYGAIGNYGVDGGAEFDYDVTELAGWTTSAAPVASVDDTTDKGVVTTHMASGSPVQIIATHQTVMGSVGLLVTAGP